VHTARERRARLPSGTEWRAGAQGARTACTSVCTCIYEGEQRARCTVQGLHVHARGARRYGVYTRTGAEVCTGRVCRGHARGYGNADEDLAEPGACRGSGTERTERAAQPITPIDAQLGRTTVMTTTAPLFTLPAPVKGKPGERAQIRLQLTALEMRWLAAHGLDAPRALVEKVQGTAIPASAVLERLNTMEEARRLVRAVGIAQGTVALHPTGDTKMARGILRLGSMTLTPALRAEVESITHALIGTADAAATRLDAVLNLTLAPNVFAALSVEADRLGVTTRRLVKWQLAERLHADSADAGDGGVWIPFPLAGTAASLPLKHRHVETVARLRLAALQAEGLAV